MLNKNNKSMFFILLIPLYLLFFACLIGISMGSVEWLNAILIAFVIIIAAWGLSKENSILTNIIGLLCFIGLGVYLIYPTLARTERIGPWTINIYVGATLVLWGMAAFVYDIIKLISKHKKQ
ncbi:hypothetical protein [Oscillibacter sp.]|uniref:hypothetical protein n=1 Tax=Oscillibacter sp. TaxID=1945593 RepID=UPI0028A0BEF2|nr:hypothetical protein [Oscillibacter sp.]